MTRERLEGIAAVNDGPGDAAELVLAPLFEGAPGFLRRLAAARPFESWDDLWRRAREIAHAMPEADQVELLDAHPRLGAPREAVSALSAGEQGYGSSGAPRDVSIAGPRTLARLAELNAAYEARFGFRYCVFVAGRPLDALHPDFEAALAADRDAELHRGLDAVVDIGRARAAGATVIHRHDR